MDGYLLRAFIAVSMGYRAQAVIYLRINLYGDNNINKVVT